MRGCGAETMRLGLDDFTYSDLQSHTGLSRLAAAFDAFVQEHDADLFRRFDT